jgi:hypothetical protein
MPTGYTYNIKDGITFKRFVLQCSRALGYFVHMRDEPANVLPDLTTEKEDTYYKEHLEEIIHSGVDTSYEAYVEESKKRKEYEEERLKEVTDLREKYEHMLKRIQEWDVPPDLQLLKTFMTQQVESSIDFDCNISESSPELSFDEWQKEKQRSYERDIEYYTKEAEKEKAQNEARAQWLKMFVEHVNKIDE